MMVSAPGGCGTIACVIYILGSFPDLLTQRALCAGLSWFFLTAFHAVGDQKCKRGE